MRRHIVSTLGGLLPMIDLRDLSVPLPLRYVRAHGGELLTPWDFIEVNEAESARKELCLEVSQGSQSYRDLHIFARRQDCDDFAGFIVEDGVITNRVAIAHITFRGAPEADGFPTSEFFDSFWDWMKRVVDDASEWAEEEELAELLSE